MIKVVEEYYKQAQIAPFLLKQKSERLDRHMDIQKEFEYWIEHKEYLSSSCVSVEGYTAQMLADKSCFLDGEGAFMLLIKLREQPEAAKAEIASGYKMK